MVLSGEVGSRRIEWQASVEGRTADVGADEYYECVRAWQHGYASRRRVPLLGSAQEGDGRQEWQSVGNVRDCYRVRDEEGEA
jgi:hypothetical protein